MAPEKSIDILQSIRSRYVRAKALLYAQQALATVVVGAAILYKWQLEAPLLAMLAVIIILGGILYFILRWRSTRQTDLRQVARHLNRHYPQLEDSTELLLCPAGDLNQLERLQQGKVAGKLQHIYPANKNVFHINPTISRVALAVGLALVLLVLYLPAASLATNPVAAKVQIDFPDAPAAAGDTAAIIEKVEITVTPPVYTGKPAYKAPQPNLRIEQGAAVSWRVTTNKPAGKLQLALNDDLPLDFKDSNKVYTLAHSFTTPALYTINLNGRRSAFYTLEIIPDEAPVIQISKPKQYTEIRFGEPQRVTLQAQISDDYGIREANIIATVAKGSGEAVNFKEEKISLGLRGIRRSLNINKTIILKELGMTYGDELYFYVQARDNYRGYTRSETYLVQIEDTAVVEAAFSMTAGVNPVPAYFRSQRQIIIDTEKLLAEQNTISKGGFEERSNSLGIDQKLLRLRYGKFLGEEFESGIGPGGGIPEGEEGHQDEEHTADDGHDHAASGGENSPEALLDPYIHKHDQEGAATIFEPAVKAKLKGALAQMWEAELRLRTHQPKEALPYEYKALRMLKDVQQSTRAYVAKTGFEAPPLKEPELRLTGELNKITPPSEQQTIKDVAQLPHTRAALGWLARYRQHGKYKPTDAQVLELAGQELAKQAAANPGHYLRALQDVRTLITDINNREKLCTACLLTAERAWASLLPPAKQTPQQQTTARSKLSVEYRKRLKEG